MTELNTEVVVIGSGPGGYTAAFRAADLGKKVILVERFKTLGGVCLNVGCIPSKALLHLANILEEVREIDKIGINLGKPTVDIAKINQWKDKDVIGKLTSGLTTLAKQRQVQIVHGIAEFVSDHKIRVNGSNETVMITFENAIIAAGSRPITLPFIPKHPRIIDSTDALKLEHTSGRLLVIGGGIIGLEMATVYQNLGCKITVVELMDQLIPGADADIVAPVHKFVSKKYEGILLETKVTQVQAKDTGLFVTLEGKNASKKIEKFDQILVAVGRRPNGDQLHAEKAGIKVDDHGFISVDRQMRTNVDHIFAVGDIVGNPMLAHKATYEARIAAEIAATKKKLYFDARCIPAVAYTDPEVAWVGLTENEAKKQTITYGKGLFPWIASGRALSLGRTEGLTKLIFDKKTSQVLGAGIVGPHAGELISELALAIEMGCDAEDIALTIHPHPTLSETIMLSSEIFEGTITDLYLPKKQ
jgi:dihydrolipoamide dehydrogenase